MHSRRKQNLLYSAQCSVLETDQAEMTCDLTCWDEVCIGLYMAYSWALNTLFTYLIIYSIIISI